MDDSIEQNNENHASSSQKRRQIESPFSAATPKSRIGKEPKRHFGSAVNSVDGIEDTLIETDSLVPSDAPYENGNATLESTFTVDPNLEETELISPETSMNVANETDADVTLAESFSEKVVVQEGETTPKAPLSPIPIEDTVETPTAATAPTPIASKIERGFESADPISSPIISNTKSHIDHSLLEFELLEQKTEHEAQISNLRDQIDELKQTHEQELAHIAEARKFEEKLLMQQMEATVKKSKSDREAAKIREEELRKQIEELRTSPDNEKEQLENQLAELNSRIEELTEKALKVDLMQQGAAAYEDRLQQLQDEKLNSMMEINTVFKDMETLREELAMQCEENVKLRSALSAGENVEELKAEHESVRQMMVEEMKRLETEITNLQASQTVIPDSSEEVETLRMKIKDLEENVEKNQTEMVDSLQKSAAEISAEKENNAKLETEIERLRSEAANNTRCVELEQELEDLRKLMVSEVSDLESQLDAARQNQNSADSGEMEATINKNTEVIEKLQNDLKESHSKNQVFLAEIDSLKVELNNSLPTIEGLKEERAQSKNRCEELAESLTAQKTQYETQIATLTSDIQVLNDLIANIRADLETSKKENSEIEAKFNQQEEDSRVTIKQLTEKLEAIHQKSSEDDAQLQEKLMTSETRVEELTNSIATLETEYSAYRQQVEENSNANNQYRSEIEDLQKSLAEKTQLLEAELKEKSELENKLTCQLETSQDINSELERLQNQVQELTQSLETSRAELVGTQQINEETVEELKTEIETLKSELEMSRLSCEQLKQQSANADNLKTEMNDLTRKLEATQDELTKTHELNNVAVEELNAQRCSIQSELEETKNIVADLENQLESKTKETEENVLQMKELATQLEALHNEKSILESTISQLQTLLEISQKDAEESLSDEKILEGLKARIEELESSASSTKKDLDHAKEAFKIKEQELLEIVEEVKNLRMVVEDEKSSHQATQGIVTDLREKLEEAERALSHKENLVVTLESRIETISKQFEERLGEANVWKEQAMNMGTLTKSLTEMQENMKELNAKLNDSNRRVVEVQEMANHDITLMQEEKIEQSAALEEAQARIVELEKKLAKAEKEIERLEKVCDDFDDDETELKKQITDLQAELKQAKGIKSPPKVMGLIQQARLGIKPLSRESSSLEPPANEEGFEDAEESFQPEKSQNPKSKVGTTTILHPDDDSIEKSAIETPSKKQNRSNCQHQ